MACGLPSTPFLGDSGMVLADQSSPFGMSAKLFDWSHVEVAQRTGVVEGMNALAHVLVPPLAIHESQQVADDPSLRLFDLLAVFDERPFPDAPQDATENSATVAVCDARRFDRRAVVVRPLPAPCIFGDQVSTCTSGLEEPSHDLIPRLLDVGGDIQQGGVRGEGRFAGINTLRGAAGKSRCDQPP